MILDELVATVTALELADEAADVMTPLLLVIDGAEPLLAAAEAEGDTSMVAEIARELQRAFEAVAARSAPEPRTRLLVGASFWSLRATSADIERVAATDYRSMVMLPTVGTRADAAALDRATPTKTSMSAGDDAPPVPGLLTTANLTAGSDASDIAAPAELATSVDTAAAASRDSQHTTNTLTPVSFTEPGT